MLREMRHGIATIAIVLSVIFAARLASAPTNVELIVDDSGSMAQHDAVDSDGVTLGHGSSPNFGAVAKMENLKVAKAGWIFVKVRYYDGNNSGDYSFALGPGDIDSPPKPPPR